MELRSVLVTGANRGIGLEFVKQLVLLPEPPKYVFATYRNRDKKKVLEVIGEASSKTKIVLIQMDITKLEDVKATAKVVENTVGEEGLTLLINNAGLSIPVSFPNLSPESLGLHFSTNTIGPIMVLQELLPSLQKASKAGSGMKVSRAAVLNISSRIASINNIVHYPKESNARIGYRASKAALNMAMRATAEVVKDDGILVLLMSPGWVKTDMGTDQAMITVKESVSNMLDTISRMDESHHGLFFDRLGNLKPF